jgi:importin subunit beta-1
MATPNVVDLTNLLVTAAQGNAAAREAESQLNLFQQNDYPGYIASLAAELQNSGKPADSRRLAGILLKNSLDARDDARKLELQAKWGQLPADLRTNIKTSLLTTLSSDQPDVRHTAAMVTAKVAAIELPHKQWPDLVTSLINTMGSQPASGGLKQATLEALGYICEEMAMIKEEVLTPAEVNMILTAVVAGMRPDEQNMDIRLAATNALSNAIEFAEHNFENEQERNYIMQMVCHGTVAQHPKIRVESFFCLHEIAAGYYKYLPAYMQEVFNITINCIKNAGEDEEVRLQVRGRRSCCCK